MDALLCKSPHNRRFQNAHVFQNRRPNLKIAKRTRAVSVGKKMFGVCNKVGEGGTHPQVKWQQKLHAKQGFVCCFNMQDPLQSHAVDTATPSTNQADLHIASILIPCALLKLIKKSAMAGLNKWLVGLRASEIQTLLSAAEGLAKPRGTGAGTA